MNFEFSDEQEQLRATVRRFVTDRASLTEHARPHLGDERGLDAEIWAGLADLGVLGLLDPSADGGADMVSAGVVLEELGRAVGREPYIASAVGAMTALGGSNHTGITAELAAGTRVATVALHEPGLRYRWHQPNTEARADAQQWRLTGEKVNVLGGTVADSFVVSARADDGLALFLVDRTDVADHRVLAESSVDGTRPCARLVLDDTPAQAVAGGDADGRVRAVVDHVAVALVADAVGAAAAALELAVAYAKERKQFGVPIGSFQAVQHLCADMLREIEITRAIAYYALWACRSADASERHRAAVSAKAYASEVLPHVAEMAIQVFGGVGFTWENDAHLFYKRTLSAAALYGNADDQYAALADVILPPLT